MDNNNAVLRSEYGLICYRNAVLIVIVNKPNFETRLDFSRNQELNYTFQLDTIITKGGHIYDLDTLFGKYGLTGLLEEWFEIGEWCSW